jgi:iron complex outermembrane receptor protein
MNSKSIIAGTAAIFLAATQPLIAQTVGGRTELPELAAASPPGDAGDNTSTSQVPVTAASNPVGQLEEIMVTAQKRSENLQDVPIAVTAVTAAMLEKIGVRDLTDLSGAVPGLNVTNNFGRLTLSLRGIGSTSVGPGVENPIALYIDGVYYASTTASLLSLNNINQLEVLKGPQGTLFGRNATGGLVQVTSKDPTQTTTGSFDLTYGNYQTEIASGYLAGGLADNLAADIAIYAKHQGEGWGRDLFNGQNVYEVDHDVAVRSKLVFTPSDLTKLTLIADYNDIKDGMNPSTIKPGSISPFEPGVLQPDLGYNVDNNYQPPHLIRTDGVSLRWDQGISDLKLSSITAYRHANSTIGGDIDGLPIDKADFIFYQYDQQFTQELQLSSKSAEKLQWTAGLFYYDGKSGYSPFYIPLRYAGINVTYPSTNEKITSEAAYSQFTYAVADDTNLTLGGRFTDEKHTLFGSSTGIIPIDAPLSSIMASAIPNASETNKEFTDRASIDHRFSKEVLAYASYNRGFKAGGYSVSSPTAPPFSPEILDAFEIGAKTDLFDRRVRFNTAIFYDKYDNIQVQRYNAISIETVNGAKARSYGVDADLTAVLAPGLQFTGGVTVADATFTSFPNCVLAAPLGGVALFGGNCTGYMLPIAAKTTGNVMLDYVVPLAKGSIDLNGNVYYNSGYFTDIANVIHQKDYTKLGVFGKWSDASDHYSIQLYGKNLTNRRVIVYGDSQGVGTQLVNYGEPRTYGVTVGYKF